MDFDKINENNSELIIQSSKYGSLNVTLNLNTTKSTNEKEESSTTELSKSQSLPPKPAIRQRTAAALQLQLQKQQQQQLNNKNTNHSNSLPIQNNKQREEFRKELEIKLEKESRKKLNNIIKNVDNIEGSNDNLKDNKNIAESKLTKSKVTQQEQIKTNMNQSSSTTTTTTTTTTSSIINEQNQITECCHEYNQKRLEKLNFANKEGKNSIPIRPYPKKVLFIIVNEFCERFSYYGLRTVLVLYLKNVLGFSDSTSTISFHLFASLCYLTPILGAILADSVLGKYRTIFYLSIIYFIGELFLVLSSIFWDFGYLTISNTFIGLILIGIGTGGIKPCVCALGGDQFLPNEEKRLQGFFSFLYASINLGSLISMFATPLLRTQFKCVNREDCYPYAFGLPCLLMFVGIVVFASAKNQYTLVPLPEKNVILTFCSCIWLALKRKFYYSNGDKTTTNNTKSRGWKKVNLLKLDNNKTSNLVLNNKITSGKQSTSSTQDSTSNSTLSISSNEDSNITSSLSAAAAAAAKYENINPKNLININNKNSNQNEIINSSSSDLDTIEKSTQGENLNERIGNNDKTRNHWLYLASDKFDLKSIEDFRSVLSILLLFIPLPVYWCLYDQQSSLWILQANRMDGRIFNTNYILQPDQISVANPIILLSLIPIFEFFIYPTLNSCNLLTKPLQKMTFGGLLAALTFLISSLIELKIQENLPPTLPMEGNSNLIFINGLSDCSIVNPMISYVEKTQILNQNSTLNNELNDLIDKNYTKIIKQLEDEKQKLTINLKDESILPLSFKSIDISSANSEKLFNNYNLKFKLSSNDINNDNQSNINNCPFNSMMEHEFNIQPLKDKSVKFLYIEQGNGKLTYKLFNESLELPPIGKARIRLIYESFGSLIQAEKRLFYLTKVDFNSSALFNYNNNNNNNNTDKSTLNQFKGFIRDGQVSISDYLDIDVSSYGQLFQLITSDSNLKLSIKNIFLQPGTRNLIIAHQKNATFLEVNYQLLQDNNYRISMLYQLIPFSLISVSEVMFSITGSEFSYSMAPDNMKSIILGAWVLTVAFGNMLIVVVESLQLFSNIAYDFLFYAIILAIDMVIFGYMSYNFKPYNRIINK